MFTVRRTLQMTRCSLLIRLTIHAAYTAHYSRCLHCSLFTVYTAHYSLLTLLTIHCLHCSLFMLPALLAVSLCCLVGCLTAGRYSGTPRLLAVSGYSKEIQTGLHRYVAPLCWVTSVCCSTVLGYIGVAPLCWVTSVCCSTVLGYISMLLHCAGSHQYVAPLCWVTSVLLDRSMLLTITVLLVVVSC